MVVPSVAMITFCPALTLAAPQTIVEGISAPILTVVRLSCFSFTINVSQVSTSPTTKPFKPPFIDSISSMPSTSKPVAVNNLPISSADSLISIRLFNQLYEIFICAIFAI